VLRRQRERGEKHMDNLKKMITLTVSLDGKQILTREIAVLATTIDFKDIGSFLADIGEALKRKT
jgi:hypothetical protein